MIDGSDFSQEGDRTQLFDRVIEKFLMRLPHCATAQTHLHSRLSQIRTQRRLHNFSSVDEKDAQLRVCDKLHTMFERQYTYAQLHHSDVSGQSDSIARKARCTSHEPNLIQQENRWWRFDGNSRCSVWSRPIFSKSWRSCSSKWRGATWVQFTKLPKGAWQMEKFQHCNKDFFTMLNTWCMVTLELRNWRSNCRRQVSNSLACKVEFLIGEFRWDVINQPNIETQKFFEIEMKNTILWLVKVFDIWNDKFSAHKEQ